MTGTGPPLRHGGSGSACPAAKQSDRDRSPVADRPPTGPTLSARRAQLALPGRATAARRRADRSPHYAPPLVNRRKTSAMTVIMSTGLLTVARAEALFTSDLSTQSRPTCAEVTATIRRAIRIHGGSRGCATVLAGEYGEHPETAAPRMRWALGVVHAVYASTRPRHPN